MSTSLHSYPHADSSLLKVSIEFLCLSITVVQFLFTTFTGLFHKKCNRLKARVVIYAYQHHVRLLSSEPVVVMQPKCTVEGADIVMQSSEKGHFCSLLSLSSALFDGYAYMHAKKGPR